MVDLSSVGGIVSIPLMFVSVLSLAIIIERIIFWNSVLSKQERIRSNILSMHSGNNKIISNNKKSDHPLIVFYNSLIQSKYDGFQELQTQIKIGLQYTEPVLNRFDTTLSTIVAIAPLLGLLGTVLGLIRAFHGISLGQPLENTEVVISGISEALVSTAIGLIVAIITLSFTNLFRSLKRKEKHELLLFATRLESQQLELR
jgi:biopolymer transport protein ExbB